MGLADSRLLQVLKQYPFRQNQVYTTLQAKRSAGRNTPSPERFEAERPESRDFVAATQGLQVNL